MIEELSVWVNFPFSNKDYVLNSDEVTMGHGGPKLIPLLVYAIIKIEIESSIVGLSPNQSRSLFNVPKVQFIQSQIIFFTL